MFGLALCIFEFRLRRVSTGTCWILRPLGILELLNPSTPFLSAFLGYLFYLYPVVMTNIAMENDPFIDDFPMNTTIYSGFSMAMLNNQMVDTCST